MISTAPELTETQEVESKELATQIHELMCSWNHVEGCDWYYAKNDSNWENNYGRRKYLKLAYEVMHRIDSKVAMTVITTLVEKR